VSGWVVLVGFMGAGKTAVGRRLAERLGVPFVDLDRLIETQAGAGVAEIFAREGEAGFRAREREAVARLAAEAGVAGDRGDREPAAGHSGPATGGGVLATGGGALLDPENFRLLRRLGIVVALTVSAEEAVRRLEGKPERPLLAGGEPLARARALLEARAPLYRQADASVPTEGRDPDQVVATVARLLEVDEVRVDLGGRGYSVHVGLGLVCRAGALLPSADRPHRVLIVSDPPVWEAHGNRAAAGFAREGLAVRHALVPAGEACKTLAQAERLYDRALDAGLDRGDAIAALGGGAVGDLAGFVAATYLRGVDFIQLPTTLVAQVDASVGGKVAVNHPRGKNLIGAFHQPRVVVADPSALRTLPDRELASGLAEVVKHGCIADPGLVSFVRERAAALMERDPGAIRWVVRRSCEIKAAIVARDERETGVRAHLNFGHTVGHAVEKATGFGAWLHGEAVAAGMVAEARLAARLGVCADEVPQAIEAALAAVGLPVRLPPVSTTDLLDAMAVDKKVRAGRWRLALPEAVGKVGLRDGIDPAAVARVLAELGARG